MSYSFQKRGATKAILMAMVIAELDNVVSAQPVHVADRAQAQAAAEAFLDIVPDADETQDYYVSVSGSVTYKWDGANNKIKGVTGASINVSASLVQKE